MGKRQLAFWWLAGNLCATPAIAAGETPRIAPQQWIEQQELPALDGPMPLSGDSAAPGELTLSQAVNRAVTWHPSIAEVVGKR